MTASIPLAWLGTYLIHSTLLLGAVWVVTRWLGRRDAPLALASEERLWKTALVGGLLTATLQISLAYAPGVDLPAFAPWATEGAPASTATMAEPSLMPYASPAGDLAVEPTGLATSPTPHPGLRSLAALVPGWQRLVLASWILGATAGLTLLALSWIGLCRTLRGRRTVHEGPTRRALDRLLAAGPLRRRGRRPVRLSASERLPVPIALGILEREICVPERALETFGPRRQEGLLAHELAHLERRDPTWTLALRAIEAALFLQPLNRVARRRLLEIAEDRSDTWAVEQTGDRVGLARSLTDVATWLSGLDPAPLASPVPGMAGDRRALGRRVRRILDGASADEGRTPGRWNLPLAAAALLAIGCLAPGVAPAVPAEAAVMAAPMSESASESVSESAADEAPEWQEPASAAEHDHALPRELHGEWEPDEAFDDDLEHLEHLEHLEQLEHLEHLEDLELDPHLESEIERIIELAESLARHAPNPEQLAGAEALAAQLEEAAERSMAVHEATVEQLQMTLSEHLAGVAAVHELSDEERARLADELRRVSEEAQRIAEQARPNEEELARLHELARQLATEAVPTHEEIERMNHEVERMNRDIQRMNRELERTDREDLRQVEERVLQNRERVERRLREEVEREMGAARAELEAEREAMRAERQRMDAEQEAHRHELEELHRELDERREALEQRHQELIEQGEEHEHEESGEEHEPPE